jgi:hypothetical protein
MPLCAKVTKRIEVPFVEGEIIPPVVLSYLLSCGKVSPNNIQLGEEE